MALYVTSIQDIVMKSYIINIVINNKSNTHKGHYDHHQ